MKVNLSYVDAFATVLALAAGTRTICGVSSFQNRLTRKIPSLSTPTSTRTYLNNMHISTASMFTAGVDTFSFSRDHRRRRAFVFELKGTNMDDDVQATNDNDNDKDPADPDPGAADLVDEQKQSKSGVDVRGFFDSIWTSPLYSAFLFWTPFVANPKLRTRFSNFVSNNVDLRIAVPVTVVSVLFVGIYVYYQNRVYDVIVARNATEDILRELREIRRMQMSSGGYGDSARTGSGSRAATSAGGQEDFKEALGRYEKALREEVDLRSEIASFPGDGPEGPDKAAAEQFLGMRINEDGVLVSK